MLNVGAVTVGLLALELMRTLLQVFLTTTEEPGLQELVFIITSLMTAETQGVK